MTKGETALNLFSTGLACSQAVALSFKDELGIDENTLKNLSLGFGGGLHVNVLFVALFPVWLW